VVGSAGQVGFKARSPRRDRRLKSRAARQELEPKARPGAARKTPQRSAERRPHIDEMCGLRKDWCATRRSVPSAFVEGKKLSPPKRGKTTAYPGPIKNTGDDAWLFEI
jgi:hypothetical protein